MKKLLIVVAAIFVVYGVFVYKDLQGIKKKSTRPVLRSMPNAMFVTMEGELFSIKQHASTNNAPFTFFHFWGTWCGPCAAEFPRLVKYAQWAVGKGAHFYLVAINDEVAAIQKYLSRYKLPPNTTVLIDNDGEYGKKFGSLKVPETYLFKDFSTLRKFVGAQQWGAPEKSYLE